MMRRAAAPVRRSLCTPASLHARRLATTPAVALEASDAASAFRRWGHLEAKLDPLGVARRAARPELAAAATAASPAEVERLRAVYSGPLGTEFEHLDSAEERAWWASKLESSVPSDSGFSLSVAQKRNAATALLSAHTFEKFLGKKFVGFKRYSGEGTESLAPALDTVLAASASAGVKDVVVGMAHRGRLALQVTALGYPARKLFHKIMGNDDIPESVQGVDDVSSHIPHSVDKTYGVGERARKVHVSYLANPSHLEAVNPVAVGKTRAKQDAGSANALCCLIHGDAAVYGQGVVAETYGMARLPGYNVGGSLHIITNNQVGFTADERTSRSSTYASDLAKIISAPVLHVNAECLREVVLACQLAVEYRNTFGKDVVIDLIGFRRHGHNELDAPEFTQPAMYAAIARHKPFAEAYAEQLIAEGVMTEAQRATLLEKFEAHLEAEYTAAKTQYTTETGSVGVGDGVLGSGKHVVADGTSFGGKWRHMRQASAADMATSPDTGYDVARLRNILSASVALPAGFKVHDRLTRGHVQARLAMLKEEPSTPTLDWASAEALAFGSLLEQGHDVRMSGQDAQRGTFSHRHAALTDQTSGEKHMPLNSLAPEQKAKMSIVSSFLSEFGVLGFEFGYSWESPDPLVVWEAQFGDFANGAQIIIDNFLTGTESKWLRQSGLVMLLPHGYDGAGPEHSSARLERFLQLVNSQAVARGAPCLTPEGLAAAVPGARDKSLTESTNLIVANPTTPANYFHLLRRQVVRPFRKPLVMAGPKVLLRHPTAVSSFNELAPGTTFKPVLCEPIAAPESIQRVLLVSGKLYLELTARRAAVKTPAGDATAIVRIEELAPFPTEAVEAALRQYTNLREVTWVQEEPANAGAWTWAEAHLAPSLAAVGLPPLKYVGRPALPTPAVGLSKFNKRQQDHLLAVAFPASS